MTIYLGIDPGQKGGWALLAEDGFVIDAASLNLADLRDFANAVARADIIGLERAQGAKDQGHQFEYGRGFGRIEGVIVMVTRDMELKRVFYMPPAFWKAKMGVSADKKKAIEFARRLMPELFLYENRLGNVPDGIAEAALIARAVLNSEIRYTVEKNKTKREREKMRKRISYRD